MVKKETKPLYREKFQDLAAKQWLKPVWTYFMSVFSPIITNKMTLLVFTVSTWKEYKGNIWNGTIDGSDKLGGHGTLNKVLILYFRETSRMLPLTVEEKGLSSGEGVFSEQQSL